MKVFITGITGFVGAYLADHILQQGNHELWGFRRGDSNLSRLGPLAARIHWTEGDMRDAASVKHAIAKARPQRIFHLAAQSYLPTSWRAPSGTLLDNLVGELHILEALRELKLNCRLQIAGSSEEYGLVGKHEIPVNERHLLQPVSPYAVSKVAQDLLAFQYHHSYNIQVVRTRAFNHDGPGRPDIYAASSFCKQIALIEGGKQEPILQVGNLDAVRDFTDVRDVVRGYWLALERGVAGEAYNICSGRGWSMRQIIRHLLQVTHLRVKIKVDRSRMRPSDVPVLIGDNSKFRKATGWEPQIAFEQTLDDMLNYWRRERRTGVSRRTR